MVGNGFDVVENVRIIMLAALALISRTLNHVPEMRNHAGLDEALAVLVKVHSPGIAGALRKALKNMFCGMIAPHSGSNRCAFTIGRTRFANVGMCEHAVASIEPAVRPPIKCVQRFVRILVTPTIKENL